MVHRLNYSAIDDDLMPTAAANGPQSDRGYHNAMSLSITSASGEPSTTITSPFDADMDRSHNNHFNENDLHI